MASSVVVPVYDPDIQQHQHQQLAAVVAGVMDAISIPTDPLLAAYPPEILPAQAFSASLDPAYLVKPEAQDDIIADMQVVPDDPSAMFLSIPMPVDPMSGLPPLSMASQYATEIVPEPAFAALVSADPSMAVELPQSIISTPSPPILANGAQQMPSIQTASSSYSVATTSSLDSALIPLTSPTHSGSSLSPILAPSPYAASASQSPPASLSLSTISNPEDDVSLKDEMPMVQQKGAIMHMLDTMVRDIIAAKDAVIRTDAVNESEMRDLLASKMHAISRMAANINLNSAPETTPPPPVLSYDATQMVGISEVDGSGIDFVESIPGPSLPTFPDSKRKRNAAEMDLDALVVGLKREPPEDGPLPLPVPDPLMGGMPSVFPATSAIPLSSQLSQSRPGTRPPTPQSAFGTAPGSFLSQPSITQFTLPTTTNIVLKPPPPPVNPPVLPISANPSFSSVRPNWPEPSVNATSRHHHSLSAGAISNPMAGFQMSMPPPMQFPPVSGLASGPTTPITVNPPLLNRASRSGSLGSVNGTLGFYQEPSEPPLKKAALGTRSARSSTVGSNWYFGNDSTSPSNTSEEPNTARNTPSDDEDDSSSDSDSEARPIRQNGAASSSTTTASTTASDIPLEYLREVDRVFHEYLTNTCNNLDATDSKGDQIHQPLMAKKMQRLNESTDFRPFKFRIQAFTAGFLEELARQGYPEDKIPMKKVRNYLWHHPYILRFNEEGKKAKSKGNHIWNVEARKLEEGQWEFRPFSRKIGGGQPPIAYCGLKWMWQPRIWDPQASFNNVKVAYSSPKLPSWLAWKGDVLSGTPPSDAESCSVTIIAQYTLDGTEGQLERTIDITIAPVSSVENNAYPRSRRPSVSDIPPRRSSSDSALAQAPSRSKTRPLGVAPPQGQPLESASTRVIRVLQTVAQRVTEEAQWVSAEPQVEQQLQDIAKSKAVIEQTVEAMDQTVNGHAQVETQRLAIAAQQVVIQAAANVIADRNVMIGRAPVVPNKSTAVQRVSVNELSDATHDAIVQAVKTNGTCSTGVDIVVAAAAILKAQAPGAEAISHPPSTAITRPPHHPSTLIQTLSPLPEYT